jgi:hypothetical protein
VAFGRQVYAAAAQALGALSNDAAQTLLYKHLGAANLDRGMMGFVAVMTGGADEPVGSLITELVGQQNQLRHNAPTRHVFDTRVRDLGRWLFHDGLSVEDGRLVALGAAVEEATGVRDLLLDELAASGLDADRALERAVNEAAQAFRSDPPDFNESTTKVRIALETVARRAAPALAVRRNIPADTWGAALAFFRVSAGLLTLQEEQALSAVYTLISPGAHRPTGLTDDEWARLARTLALSATYFLIRKYRTAP